MAKKKSKFNVNQSPEGKKKRTHNGILFSSELEKDYYVYLLEQQSLGLIESIELQPKFLLQKGYVRKCDGKKILPIYYIADFNVDGKIIDTKGMPKSDGILKRKMFEYLYPDISFSWVSWSKQDGGWIEYDLLMVERRKRKKDKDSKNKSEKTKEEVIKDMLQKHAVTMQKLADS